MAAKVFYYPLTIKETHLDTFGHVNNAVYLTLLEEARWDLLNKNGYTLQKIQAAGVGPTILEIKISFLKELRVRQEVMIETQMISYEKKIGTLLQTIVRDGKVCCKAEFLISLFDIRARKIIPPTEEWLTALGMSSINCT